MLRDRNIALVVAARFVSRVGGSAAFFIGVWGTAAYAFGADATALAKLSAINAIAGLLGTLVAGVAIDRIGPRRVLVIAEILTIPAVLAMSQADTLMWFAVFSAGFSFAGVPTFTAGASFAPFLVEGRDKLEKVNALIDAAGSTGFILGPALGAVVSQAFGLPAVFVLMAAASVIAAVLGWLIRIDETPAVPDESGERHPLSELKDGLALSYATRSLRYYILLGTAAWFTFGAFSALEPLFFRDVVGVGVEWIGYMNTGFGIGLVTGAWLLPRLPGRVLTARGAAVVTALLGLGAIGYVGTASLPVIAVGAVTWGIVIGLADPLLRTLIHLDTPHDFVGRVMGTVQLHRSAGELVPLAFAPALAALVGVQPVLIGGGVLVAIASLLSLPVAASIDGAKRDEQAAEEPSPATVS